MMFNDQIKEKMQDNLNRFNGEVKYLRQQMMNSRKELTSKDLAFVKMRNICAMHEFIIIHLKRYLLQMNFRMVYKLLGMVVPK